MNITRDIEKRLAENKTSIKTYASHQMAQGRADKICDDLQAIKDTPKRMRYILSYVPSTGRFTPVFLLGEWLRANNTGGYVGFLADEGFMSV